MKKGAEEEPAQLSGAVRQAQALQQELASLVVIEPLGRAPRSIGAVDAAYRGGATYAAAVCCRFDSLALTGERVVVEATSFP